MEKEPKRVIQFNDKRMVPKNETLIYIIIKKLFWGVVILAVVGSVVFKEFLLSGASISLWVCFFITISYLLKTGGHVRAECYTELWLFEDYMVMYVPRNHIGRGKDKMEYQKMFYRDVTECIYRVNSQKFAIFGQLEETHYRYGKDGNIMKNPCYHKCYDGMIGFYTIYATNINFNKELETYTPLTVREQEA